MPAPTEITRTMGPDEIREMWRRCEMVERATMPLTSPELILARNIVGWRLVRELARMLGVTNRTDRIEDALATYGDMPKALRSRPPADGSYRAAEMLLAASAEPDSPLRVDPAIAAAIAPTDANDQPVPITQPPPPDPRVPHRAGVPLLPHTLLRRDPARLDDYIAIMRAIADHLGVSGTEYGQHAVMTTLLNKASLSMWPTADDIMHTEGLLVAEAADAIVQHSIREAERFMVNHMGLRKQETRALLALAKQDIGELMESNVEEDRSIISARLEDNAIRSRDAMDHRAEQGALKALAMVKGVTRAEPVDDDKEFVRMVKRVENETPGPTKRLDGDA